ncbi:MAG: hypothetical protein J6A61_03425 [Clostridia bacterium]|nr:hypothetical protein [Clostridia bacterium]
MKKEFFKTAVLTCLVISSLMLSVHIWYEKELWSLDYSSFVYSLKNLFEKENSGKFSSTDELIYWSEFSPEFISFTYGSQKVVTYNSSPEFSEAARVVSSAVSSLTKEGDIVSVTEEEYLNTYKTNSMMLKFPVEINLLEFLKQEEDFFDTIREPYVNTVVIGIDESQTNYLSFLNNHTGHAYRMPVKTDVDSVAISQAILASNQNSSFAFELNFDVKKDDSERILFHRFVPITLEEQALQSIEAKPIFYSSNYDGIFKALGIVKNSARTYRDKEGTVHFIENRSTLKIFEDGAFSFEATDPEAGVSLSNRDEKQAVLEFVNLLYQNIAPKSDAYLSLQSIRTIEGKKEYNFIYQTQNGALCLEEGPAVQVLAENGVILKYDQHLLEVSLAGNTTNTTGVLEAYDSLYNRPDFSQKSKLTIRSMFPCHILGENGITVGWICGFSDQSFTYFIP